MIFWHFILSLESFVSNFNSQDQLPNLAYNEIDYHLLNSRTVFMPAYLSTPINYHHTQFTSSHQLAKYTNPFNTNVMIIQNNANFTQFPPHLNTALMQTDQNCVSFYDQAPFKPLNYHDYNVNSSNHSNLDKLHSNENQHQLNLHDEINSEPCLYYLNKMTPLSQIKYNHKYFQDIASFFSENNNIEYLLKYKDYFIFKTFDQIKELQREKSTYFYFLPKIETNFFKMQIVLKTERNEFNLFLRNYFLWHVEFPPDYIETIDSIWKIICENFTNELEMFAFAVLMKLHIKRNLKYRRSRLKDELSTTCFLRNIKFDEHVTYIESIAKSIDFWEKEVVYSGDRFCDINIFFGKFLFDHIFFPGPIYEKNNIFIFKYREHVFFSYQYLLASLCEKKIN